MTMNYKIFPMLVASFALFGGQAQAADSSRVRTDIQPLLDEQLLAANAHDTDRFLATFLHDQKLVFVFNGVITIGWDDVRTGQLKAWNNGKSDVVYSQNGEATFTVLSPEAAVVTQPMKSVRTLPDGQVSRGKFVVTAVWGKRPEGWRIVQAHESTIR